MHGTCPLTSGDTRMRLAVISDIHGNCVALDAVLQHLQAARIDQVVCLGDAIQGGPQPAETVQRLRALGCPVVLGNADAFLLSGTDAGAVEPVTEAQLRVRAWSLAHLSARDVAFIAGFQPTLEIAFAGNVPLLCFHGSPNSYHDLIFPETPEETFQRLLGQHSGAIMCGGHTHLQQIRRIGDYFFFNPGSVGLAYDRHAAAEHARIDPWAEYAVLETATNGRITLSFHRVPYAIDALLHTYASSGRPDAEQMIDQYRQAARRLRPD